jgi:DNA-binding CsgD family transcriptional regulator
MKYEQDDKPALTKRQRDVYKKFKAKTETREVTPSVRDIAVDLGISKASVQQHLAEIRRKGWL